MEERDENKDTLALDPDKMKENLTKNVSAARDEAQKFKEKVSERTGISTQEDLREFAREMMTLVTECLREFMVGYRSGRDQETERMLNEYFQDLETEEDKQAQKTNRNRRRKPKRAILRR